MSADASNKLHVQRLRGLITERSKRLREGQTLPVVSVTNHNGIQLASETFSRQVYSRELKNYKIIKPGWYAYNPSRINVGSLARNDLGYDVCASPMYTVFELTSRDIDPEYFRAFVESNRFVQRVGANLQGSVRDALSFDALESFPINLPSLAEQRAMAEVLKALQATITQTEVLCNQLHETTESLAEALFVGCDANTGLRNTISWRSSTLAAEMASIQVGIVVKPASYYVEEGGVPALRSLNVKPNRLHMGALALISEEGHKINAKSALRAGDVVTVRTGEPGKTAIIPQGIAELNCIDIIFSRPGPNVRGAYISFFMNSRVAKRQISVLQGGLAQQHLNVGEMKRININVPPIAQQDELVKLLNSAWGRIEAEEIELQRLIFFRKALVQELLSGRLSLPESLIARYRDTPDRAA